MADQIEVYPDGGKWYFRESGETSKAYKTRGDAVAGARDSAGVDPPQPLFTADGDPAGMSAARPGRVRIVLLREDGSEHGELDRGPGAGGEAQVAEVETAGERTGV